MRRLAVMLLAAGCGDDGTAVDAVDSRPPGDAAPDAPDFPRAGGLISLGLTQAMDTNLQAGFWKTSAGGTSCMRRREGPCNVTRCTEETTSGVYAVSAGTITAASGDAMLTIEPTAEAMYPGAFMTGPLVPVGGTATVTVAGADVPAFTQDLVMPAAAAVTEPASTDAIVVDRTMDFQFRWTPGEGDVYLYFDSMGASLVYPITIGVTLRCVVPSADGEFAVPAPLLAELPAGMGTTAVTGIEEVVVPVGDYTIQVRAIAYQFAGPVTFQ